MAKSGRRIAVRRGGDVGRMVNGPGAPAPQEEVNEVLSGGGGSFTPLRSVQMTDFYALWKRKGRLKGDSI